MLTAILQEPAHRGGDDPLPRGAGAGRPSGSAARPRLRPGSRLRRRFRRRRSARPARSPRGPGGRATPSTSPAASSAAAAPRARPGPRSSSGARSSWPRARASRPGGRGRARRRRPRRGAASAPAARRGRRADPTHARPLAAPAPPRLGLVQRLRLGADRAPQPRLRRPAPGHRLRRLAPPRRRRHRHRAGDPQPGDGRPAHLRGGPRASRSSSPSAPAPPRAASSGAATPARAAWARSCRWTSSSPAARRAPRRSSSGSCSRSGGSRRGSVAPVPSSREPRKAVDLEVSYPRPGSRAASLAGRPHSLPAGQRRVEHRLGRTRPQGWRCFPW